jgi:hypothetical protein
VLYTRGPYKISISSCQDQFCPIAIAPFGDAYEKIGTIQRRLAWPLHKDDTLFQSGRPTGLNIYFFPQLYVHVEEDRPLKDVTFSSVYFELPYFFIIYERHLRAN